MEKTKEEEKDIELEDYEGYKDIDDEVEENDLEPTEISYEDFNTPNDFDVEEDYNDGSNYTLEPKKKKIKTRFTYENTRSLVTFFKIYGFIGIVIALILVGYYISVGNYMGLFIYILLMVVSYYLGYFLMGALDKPRIDD